MIHTQPYAINNQLHYPDAFAGDNKFYVVDYSGWLGDDTLATSTVTPSAGASISLATNTTTQVSFKMSTPAGGAEYVTVSVTTALGQTKVIKLWVTVYD